MWLCGHSVGSVGIDLNNPPESIDLVGFLLLGRSGRATVRARGVGEAVQDTDVSVGILGYVVCGSLLHLARRPAWGRLTPMMMFRRVDHSCGPLETLTEARTLQPSRDSDRCSVAAPVSTRPPQSCCTARWPPALPSTSLRLSPAQFVLGRRSCQASASAP